MNSLYLFLILDLAYKKTCVLQPSLMNSKKCRLSVDILSIASYFKESNGNVLTQRSIAQMTFPGNNFSLNMSKLFAISTVNH